MGLALSGSGALLRTSASDIQVFTINPDPTLTPGSATGASLSGTAASVASRGTNVIRACNSGIQTFTLAGTTLSSAGSKNTGLSATGTGVDTVGTVAVRVYSDGIGVFNVATLSAPALFGSNLNNAQSSTAASVKIFAAGTRAIRGHNSGMEIYDITAAAVPKLGAASGGLRSSGAAITINAGEPRRFGPTAAESRLIALFRKRIRQGWPALRQSPLAPQAVEFASKGRMPFVRPIRPSKPLIFPRPPPGPLRRSGRRQRRFRQRVSD